MAKQRRTREVDVEAAVAATKALGEPGPLSEALGHSSARVVIAAATTIEESEVRGCDAALVQAFTRLARGGAKEDPQCRAKVALVRALMALEADGERDAYLLGRHLVQLEDVWGPPV